MLTDTPMKAHLYPLLALALLTGTPSAPAAENPRGEVSYNIDDYRLGYDEVRYIPLRGYGCQVIWECDGMLDCVNGATGAREEDGMPYFSPLILAMLDLRQCTKFTPGMLDTPRIQGNTPEKARELVIKLINENRDNCVNDIMGGSLTPIFLAIGDLELTRLLLSKGANPNQLIPYQGITLLSHAVSRGDVQMVKLLLSYDATPQLRIRRQGDERSYSYDDPLSEEAILATSDPDKLRCIALVLRAQTHVPTKVKSSNIMLEKLINEKVPCVLVHWDPLTAGAYDPSKTDGGGLCYSLGTVVSTIHADPNLVGTSIILGSMDSGTYADGKYTFATPELPGNTPRSRTAGWSIIPAGMLCRPYQGNERLHIIYEEPADVIPCRYLDEIPLLPPEWQRAKDAMLKSAPPCD